MGVGDFDHIFLSTYLTTLFLIHGPLEVNIFFYLASARHRIGADSCKAKCLTSNVHGRFDLPRGYCLATVPSNATFRDDTKQFPTKLCSDYSFIKILVAIGQLLFAVSTLYRARGDQINQFGYAAFGLTVIQYALMSFINLLGNLLCPQYPTIYLVQSEIMLEAKASGGVFEGVVGILDEDTSNEERDKREAIKGMFRGLARRIWWLPIAWLPLAVTLVIIWAFSHFKQGQSTYTQRVLTMTWLAFGSYVGALSYEHPLKELTDRMIWITYAQSLLLLLIAAPPVGAAFWVVATEIKAYGVCTRIS